MAEGFEFVNPEFNPEFDRDDYDDIDDKLPMVPEDDYQRIILNQSSQISDLKIKYQGLFFLPKTEKIV